MFLSFVMTLYPDQADPSYNYSHMTCRACIQLPLDVDGIDTSIDTQMLKKPHIVLFRLSALYNGRKPYIGTLNKYRGGIFSGFCAEIFCKYIMIERLALYSIIQ